MKTISKFFGVVAAIAALAACNKDLATDNTDIPEVNHPTGTNELTITVNQPATKVTMEDVSGNLNWEDNESIAVVFVDGDVYEFAKEGVVSGGKASFVGKNLPDAYTLDDIRDIYYPYNNEYSTAEQYANHKVSTTQDNMKVDQSGNFDMKDLPLHWHGDEGVSEEGVELAAYNVAIIKVESYNFTPRTDVNGYMSILFKGVRNDLYKVKISSGEDLVFKVYVNGEDDALYPVFVVNYNTSASCIFNPRSTTATPTPVLPGKRYNLIQYFGDLDGVFQNVPNCKEITFEVGVSVKPSDAVLFAADKKDVWYIYDTANDRVTLQTPYPKFQVYQYSGMFAIVQNLN